MKGTLGLILAVALLPASSLASSPVDALPDVPQNWTAPPYWTPPAVSPGDGDQSGRSAPAAGRQALVTTPVPLPFVAITPCRQYNSLSSSVLADNTPRTVTLIGAPCAIPADAQAAAVNITIFNISGAGSNGVFRAGTVSPPTTAWINYPPTETQRANAGVLPLGAGGTIVVQVNQGAGSVDFVVDVFGYYSPLGVVNSLNTLAGDLTLAAGANVSITPSANTLTIAAAGGVTSVAGTNGISASPSTGAVTVTSNATSANTASTIVARDVGGNFNASSITLAGALNLPATTSAFAGAIGIGGFPFLHALGINNTFVGSNAGNPGMTVASSTDNTAAGYQALFKATTGKFNSAFGSNAMSLDTTGTSNSAFGAAALQNNLAGVNNAAFGNAALLNSTVSNSSAFGTSALRANTTGTDNSAFGFNALTTNQTGGSNAAFGLNALLLNLTGSNNTAFGVAALEQNTVSNSSAFGTSALRANTTGIDNSAFGFNALTANQTGNRNTAVGSNALLLATNDSDNTAVGRRALTATNGGGQNTAVGVDALVANTLGGNNVAIGRFALNSNTIGANNIAIGASAGTNLSSGGNNIYLGATGSATESNTLRLGLGQTSAFIEGVSGQTSALGVAVLINSGGKLGTTTSSKRFKEEIVDMDSESDVLLKLRPVSFFYKVEYDPSRTRQYGLIAEEVAEVAPALAVFDKDGHPETVRYHLVNAMLLNEVQKNRRLLDELRAERTELRRRLDALEQRLSRAIDPRPN